MNYAFDSSDLGEVKWNISDLKNESWRVDEMQVNRSKYGDRIEVEAGVFKSGRGYRVGVKVGRRDYGFVVGEANFTF